ncbi:hypothetical protein GBM01_22910, partial [Yersinia pseudotuberculosis]|nr:hypothetical protein [Yersinia pseudotuberculosis]
IHVGSSRAILGADALLLCLSSPFKIASSGFVSSLSLHKQAPDKTTLTQSWLKLLLFRRTGQCRYR